MNGDRIAVSQTSVLNALPWQGLDVDLVMECSGAFTDRAQAEYHLEAGARRVLFSQPAESDVDATLVYGINHEQLSAEARIVSNASCTTNCIVPVLKALDQSFGLLSGVITTIHSAMNDQPVIDSYHNSDLRKTRSAMQSIIPVDTELARGLSAFCRTCGSAGSAGDSCAHGECLRHGPDCQPEAQRHRRTDQRGAEGFANALPPNVLGVSDELLASCDYNHDPRSAVVDSNQTRVAPNNLVKLLVWFDNEWAYANRMLDVAQLMSHQ